MRTPKLQPGQRLPLNGQTAGVNGCRPPPAGDPRCVRGLSRGTGTTMWRCRAIISKNTSD